MMASLFSIFDPHSVLPLGINWVSLGLSLMFFMNPYWAPASMISLLIKLLNYFLVQQITPILNNKLKLNSTLIFIGFFHFIMMINLMSLFPYVFSSTAHMSITLSLSLPIWGGIIFYSGTNVMPQLLSHMLPQGTPSLLMPVMVLIETISNLIRPGTLAIRLMANMVAGHLLMTLLANLVSQSSTILIMLLFSQIILILLEIAVSIIQAYVFTILLTLYFNETMN